MSARLPTCREIAEFLWAYVGGELSAEERAEFDRHIALCGCCHNYLDTYRATIELSREVLTGHATVEGAAGTGGDAPASAGVAPRPPESPPEDLVQAILAARRKRP